MDAELWKLFCEEINKKGFIARLTAITGRWVQGGAWNTAEGLPKGREVEDLVSSAIEKTIKGIHSDKKGKGIRKWNPKKCPSLLHYLVWVIISDAGSLNRAKEHAATEYFAHSKPEDLDDEFDETCFANNFFADKADGNTQERYELLISELYKSVADEKEVRDVLMAIEEIIKDRGKVSSSEVMSLTGLDYKQYRNATRKLTRRVGEVQLKLSLKKEVVNL